MRLPIARRSALEARVRELEEARNERNRLAIDLAGHVEARRLAEASATALRGDRNRLQAALARAQAEVLRHEDAIAQLQLENSRLAGMLAEAATIHEATTAARSALETELRDSMAQREADSVLRNTLESQIADAHLAREVLAKEHDALADRLRDSDTERTALLAHRDALAAQLDQAHGERDRLIARLGDFEAETRRLGVETLRLEDEKRQMSRVTAEVAGKLEASANRIRDLESEVSRLGAETMRLENEKRQMSRVTAKVAGKLEAGATRISDLESEISRLGAETMRLESNKRSSAQLAQNLQAKLDGVTEQLAQAHRRRQISLSTPAQGCLAEMDKAYFISSSLGRTASQWLVSALNVHPDILATHAMDIEPFKKPPASTGKTFVDSLERQRAIRAAITNVDDAFDILEGSRYRVLGNVHGLDSLPAFENPKAFRRRYHASYVVRHPVLRLRSFVDRWKYEIDLDTARRESMRTEFNALSARHTDLFRDENTDLSVDENWLFAYAILYLLPAESVYLRSRIPLILFERLVTDKDYLAWYVNELTCGSVDVTPSFLDTMIASAPVDARRGSARTAHSEFEGWHSWKRQFFGAVLSCTGTRDHYSQLGYDTFQKAE